MKEIFKPIPGSTASASNRGRIRNHHGRILQQARWGRIAACKVDGQTCSIARVVARAWLGLSVNDRRQVRRRRGRSNAPSNLYLTRLRGEECRHKLINSEVLAIYESDKPQAALACEYRVTKSCISKVQSGRNWAWLTQPRKPK
jgi:hypothetical protein